MSDQPYVVTEAVRIGGALRDRRLLLGVTQEEVAELAQTTQRFVSTLERGKVTVRLDKVLEVADVLGLRLALEERSAADASETDGG